MASNTQLPKYLSIGQASKYLNIAIPTLRLWERKGIIKPIRTAGNQRRYTLQMLDDALAGKKPAKPVSKDKLIIGYCRVSSDGQKNDLKRQIAVVTNFCEMQGKPFKIISDIGSGLNYHKKGLKELIHLICTQQCSQVVVNYQDRLVRFGFELIEDICQENDVEITVINQTKAESSNEELVDDVLSVITVYSAKLYGKRSHHNEKIIKTNQELFKDR